MGHFRYLRAVVAGLLMLLWAITGHAQTVLTGIDFGPDGLTPVNWNPVSGVGTFTGLVDDAGDPVPTALAVSGVAVASFPVIPLASTVPQHDVDLGELAGSIYTFEDRVDLLVTGLSPDTTYQLWVFGVRDIEGRPGPAFEQRVSVNGVPRLTQVGEDRELVVNSSVGSSGTSLDSGAILAQSNASGEMLVAVEDPGNLNILGGGVYLAGLALREWDGTVPPRSIPAMPGMILLLLTGLMAWVGLRRAPRG